MTRKHAILPASGAARWLRCTPSARLEENLPDEQSPYAAEGTLAHSVAELKVRKKFIEPMSTRKFNTLLKKLGQTQLYIDNELRDPKDYWPEMLRCTDEYLDYISGVVMQYPIQPHVAAEVRLDLSHYIPEGFGTGDCIIIGGDTLHVVDYKHGKGVPVDVESNPQLMLYGLGALQKYELLYSISTVALTIFQPRAEGDTIKEWSISTKDLKDWGESIKPTAETAFKGEGEFVPGDWCQFCRARHTCRHRAGQYTALEDFGGLIAPSKMDNGTFPLPPLLSDTEVGEVLTRAIDIEKWISDLKDYALSAILNGKEISGWKLVEGVSRRKWDDPDKAFNAIKAAGIDEALLYERKPLTLAGIEKMLGKPKFAEIAGTHVVVPQGAPTLVTESDKRPAYNPKPTAEEDFNQNENEKEIK